MSDVAEPVEEPTPEPLPELFGVPMTESRGQTVLHPDREGYHALVSTLRDEGYLMCIDVTAVDYLGSDGRSLPGDLVAERFEVVSQFLDHQQRRRVRIRIQVPADDASVASITDLYPGAEALEREAHDMFGITFDDHPDLTRILMPEDWIGFPLRKDYDVGRIPVQFRGAAS